MWKFKILYIIEQWNHTSASVCSWASQLGNPNVQQKVSACSSWLIIPILQASAVTNNEVWQSVGNKCPHCLPGTPFLVSMFAVELSCSFLARAYGIPQMRSMRGQRSQPMANCSLLETDGAQLEACCRVWHSYLMILACTLLQNVLKSTSVSYALQIKEYQELHGLAQKDVSN